MANHSVTVELYYDDGGGADWQPARAYARDGISLSRGARGEGYDSPPSSAAVTLDDRSGTYSPLNPESALYGAAGRNTPVRISADSSVRLVGEASSWAPGRDVTGRDAWTEIQADGMLRRLLQGNTPLKSVAYRSLTSPTDDALRVAYWPCEEESGATSIASPVGSPTPGTAGTVTFGAYTDGLSTPRMLTFGSEDGLLFFTVPPYTSTEHKVVSLWTLPDPSLAANTVIMRFYCSGGNVGIIDVEYGATSDGTLRLNAYGSGGLVDSGNFIDWSDYIVGQHFLMSIELTQNGANVDSRVFIENMDHGTLGAAGDDVLTGVTVGKIYAITVAENDCTGASFGHLAVGNDIGAFSAFIGNIGGVVGARGYYGEQATSRFLRLADEENITASLVGDESDGQEMGTQGVGTALDLLRECVTVDDGLLFEARDALEMVMRTGRSRYNQDAALSLSFTDRQIGPGLELTLDDGLTRNDVVASRPNGSSARAVQETGVMNVQDPTVDPQGVGRYDHEITVNVIDDDALTDQANWHLAKGTQDEPRWPDILVDLDRAPSLITAVNALEIGDRVTIGDLPISWLPDDASLLVVGIREDFPPGRGSLRRTVTLICEPAGLYDSVGTVAAAAGGTDVHGQAIDTDNSTLSAGINTVATSLSVASTGGVLWTTTSSSWNTSLHGTGPYGGGLFVRIGGEVMRITNITGASSPQTFTVVRSVNGVVKSHSSGAAVHVAHVARIGL